MGNPLVISIAALFLLVLVGYFISRQSTATKGLPKNATSNSTSNLQELIRSGRKIEAIKLYRQQTGAGLKEAKDAVEAIAAGNFNPHHSKHPAEQAAHPALEDLIRAGRKIEAIKLYREQTGVGLKQAKDQVEALEKQLGRR